MSQKVINKYFIEVISFKKLKFKHLYGYWKNMWIKNSFCGKIIVVFLASFYCLIFLTFDA